MSGEPQGWPWWKVAGALIGFVVGSLWLGYKLLEALANGALR